MRTDKSYTSIIFDNSSRLSQTNTISVPNKKKNVLNIILVICLACRITIIIIKKFNLLLTY